MKRQETPKPAAAAEVASWFGIRKGPAPTVADCAEVAAWINRHVAECGIRPLSSARLKLGGGPEARAIRLIQAHVAGTLGYVRDTGDAEQAELLTRLSEALTTYEEQWVLRGSLPGTLPSAVRNLACLGNAALHRAGRPNRAPPGQGAPLVRFVLWALAHIEGRPPRPEDTIRSIIRRSWNPRYLPHEAVPNMRQAKRPRLVVVSGRPVNEHGAQRDSEDEHRDEAD